MREATECSEGVLYWTCIHFQIHLQKRLITDAVPAWYICFLGSTTCTEKRFARESAFCTMKYTCTLSYNTLNDKHAVLMLLK